MAGLSDWKTFPRAPGVYLMSDARGKILYVGKANSLRARLHNYSAPGGDGRPQVPHLLPRVADVRCIVTATEKDALLLENTLIKKHRPQFNVFLRDDKEYLLLRIDRNEPFPRPELVRRVSRDGASYFGPYSSAKGIRETMRLLYRMFYLCSCSPKKFAKRRRACLNHQLGRCGGACVGRISREEYLPYVDNAIRFLKGEYKELAKGWKDEMARLAGEMRFEEAAKLRDRIGTVERTLARQRVVRSVPGDVDAIGWFLEGTEAAVAVLHVRAGRLSDAHNFHFRAEEEPPEALSSFLVQHYTEEAFFPGEILLPVDLPDSSPHELLLSERAGRTVRIRTPRVGERRRLVSLASKNAAEFHRMRKEKEAAYDQVSSRLASLCRLASPPMRIEGFDISNLSGTEPVGSMVAFIGGKAVKKWYRKFAVRGIEGQDDFAMMEQVVRRRFGHGEDFGGPPDLVLIDGGKGQLSMAMAAMREAGAGQIPVIALAKERARAGGTSFRERIYLPGRANPLFLSPTDPALLLLMRVRDEAHRFAVAFQRVRRTRKAFA